MARSLIVLSAYKVGPSARNLSAPQALNIEVSQIGSPIKVSNNGVRWGSIVKPLFRRTGTHKAQVFESPNQIQTLIDNSQPGAEANLTVSAAGTNQGAATAISAFYTKCTTVTDSSAEGIRLPAATVGLVYVAENAGAGTLKVYPASGDFIDSNAVNVHKTVATKRITTFVCLRADYWKSLEW